MTYPKVSLTVINSGKGGVVDSIPIGQCQQFSDLMPLVRATRTRNP